MSGITTVDLILLGLVVLSTAVGFWRGFIKEVFALLVWVFAFLAAFHYSGSTAVLLEPYVDVPSARSGLAFVGVFLVVLIAGGLLTFLVGKLVEKTGLSGTDRLMGGIFGAARGLLLLIALILTAGFTPCPWMTGGRSQTLSRDCCRWRNGLESFCRRPPWNILTCFRNRKPLRRGKPMLRRQPGKLQRRLSRKHSPAAAC